MTTNVPAVDVHGAAAEARPKNFINWSSGFMSWAGTLDHKRIGLMYLVGVSIAFLCGGLFALLVRLHLWEPNGALFSNAQYNQIFTLHGAFMVFIFVIPAIPGSLGNIILPLMLGAKDVALPRLNLLSFYLWLTGAVLATLAIVLGGFDTGWTFYTPYSLYTNQAVVTIGLAVFVLGFSSIFTGLNFIVTTHKLRAPGMTWFRMPLFVWALYATSLLQVLATPVLGITVLLVAFERLYHIGIFDPRLGGDPVLFEHFFWFYSHPAVYIMVLPAFGIISELVSVHSRKPLFGYKLIAFSSLAIAIISFLVWGHHMFTSGQSTYAMFAFSFLTFFVAIPTAIKEFSWVATVWKGSIALNSPMLYTLAFLVIFAIGGLTGVILGALNVDIHLHDTYFVVAHFHYVMMGSIALAFFAGVHHWWPKMFGVIYNETLAKIACGIIFIGFNTTFIPQFIMGSRGMPRRYATYVPEYAPFHQASTIGVIILAVGIALMVYYLVASLFQRKKAMENQWGGVTLEWLAPTPPPLENFNEPPVVTNEVYDYSTLDLQTMRTPVK
ncbi:MAG: cbb3-type cytochrome c oxidase subunit I [Planctomycetes bacterium]|nr:cbb3-type cytochrome c oxidase subunit I [Planctomycetota bacterium]MCC7062642.1 cbb3-type cytochrome c oxidase subunit I [Planctomycetota bacterium]